MQLDQHPVFRKIILPWYDSETSCYIMIVLMIVVILFALMGIKIAHESVEYHGYIWVPVLLVVMSSGVIVSTSIRLIKRYMRRFPK